MCLASLSHFVILLCDLGRLKLDLLIFLWLIFIRLQLWVPLLHILWWKATSHIEFIALNLDACCFIHSSLVHFKCHGLLLHLLFFNQWLEFTIANIFLRQEFKHIRKLKFVQLLRWRNCLTNIFLFEVEYLCWWLLCTLSPRGLQRQSYSVLRNACHLRSCVLIEKVVKLCFKIYDDADAGVEVVRKDDFVFVWNLLELLGYLWVQWITLERVIDIVVLHLHDINMLLNIGIKGVAKDVLKLAIVTDDILVNSVDINNGSVVCVLELRRAWQSVFLYLLNKHRFRFSAIFVSHWWILACNATLSAVHLV